MIAPRIDVDEKPDPGFRQAILGPLADYNVGKIGGFHAEPVAVLLRHPVCGEIVGGLWGIVVADWLFVELLFVPEDCRTRGLGSSLMKQAEVIAVKRGCVGIRLDTYTFQAPGFYEKLGYQAFGRLDNHPRGHQRIYYSKTLAA
ncbi:MAG: GNAT family N-acetyltransferase [Rhodospirillaceae bacterium]